MTAIGDEFRVVTEEAADGPAEKASGGIADDAAETIVESPSPGYRSVLTDRSFQALSLANFVSLAGDQVARVALSVLVFQRTSSAGWTGLTYALSFLPTVLGGALLSGVADRRSRRSVMVACDLLRAALVLVMAVAALPLPALLVLLATVTLCEVPFDAARGAMMPDVLSGGRYAIGGAISQVVTQAAMVAGFAAGGALLVVASPRQLLALDAITFVLSAVLVRLVPFGLCPVALGDAGGKAARALADLRLAMLTIFRDRRLRPLVLLAWGMSAAAIAPEALAVPYANALNAGSTAIGLLLAANPVGNVLAGLVLARLPEPRRVRLLWPLATVAAAPLTLCLLHPPLPLVVLLVGLSGLGTAYHLVAMVRFVTLVDPNRRGRALGLASTGLAVSQGVAIAVSGVLGDVLNPAVAVGISGLVGLGAAVLWGPRLAVRHVEGQAPEVALGTAGGA